MEQGHQGKQYQTGVELFDTSPRQHVLSSGGTGWLGRQDSNLGMAVPKTAALPLGDAPPRRGYIVVPRAPDNGFGAGAFGLARIGPLASPKERRYMSASPEHDGFGV